MNPLEQVKKWIYEITEIGLLLIALGIVIGILFGETAPFFTAIVGNMTELLGQLGDKGLVGLIALGIIVYLFRRHRVPTQQ